MENIITYEINFNIKQKENENKKEEKKEKEKERKEFIINIDLNKPRIEINNIPQNFEIKKLSGFLKYENEEDEINKELKKRLIDNKNFEKDYDDYLEIRLNLSNKIYQLIYLINPEKNNIYKKEYNNLNNDLKYLREHYFLSNERENKIKEIENRIQEYKEKLSKKKV